jgi:hypothetical protein
MPDCSAERLAIYPVAPAWLVANMLNIDRMSIYACSVTAYKGLGKVNKVILQ